MPGPSVTLDDLRRFAIARSLFGPTTLRRALARMGFVQADPIRAPARAQDLILRQRVKNYRAGDLDRQYETLGIEEDFFINYGYVTREVQALMHPRPVAAERKRERMLLDFVQNRGAVHPREVEKHFRQGTVTNYWGGSSHATTHMLDGLHYDGRLRVVRREKGIRLYATHRHETAALDEAARRRRIEALVDVVVNIYAPLPATSLSYYVRRLRYAAPQFEKEISDALQRARQRLRHARVEGVDWFWPNGEDSRKAVVGDTVRLLAPFDPVVHDRARFEMLWGWGYRFEAYTPAAKRKLGYYALPLLWRDRVIGWANPAVTVAKSNFAEKAAVPKYNFAEKAAVPKYNLGTRSREETYNLGARSGGETCNLRTRTLSCEFGYVAGKAPRERAFKHELEAELGRMQEFLGVSTIV